MKVGLGLVHLEKNAYLCRAKLYMGVAFVVCAPCNGELKT